MDLPVNFRPKSGHRPKMSYRRTVHKISLWDQLPSTDSGYWINDFVPIDYQEMIKSPQDEVGIFPCPPHGWFSSWTKNHMERLEHTVGVKDQRFQTKKKRIRTTVRIIELLKSGIPAFSPCNMAAETVKKHRNRLKKDNSLDSLL